MKEAKAGGAYVEGGTSLHTLLTQLALRMQDQGNNFRKACALIESSPKVSVESFCPNAIAS